MNYPLFGALREFFRSKAERSKSPWRRGALSAIGRQRPTSEPNVVEAGTAQTTRSAGTVVRIELRSAGGATDALITAWRGAQLFDWGETRPAVQEIAAQLRRHS